MKRKLMAAFALLSTGCSSALPTFHLDHGQEAKSHTLVERLAIEAQGLSDMFRLRALIELATEHPTSNKLERYIAWKVSNKGNALKRLTQLLGDTFK